MATGFASPNRFVATYTFFFAATVLVSAVIGMSTPGDSVGTWASGLDGLARDAAALHDQTVLTDAMRSITLLGEELVLGAAFLALSLFAYARKGKQWGWFFALTGVGALALDNVVKPLVGRPRPTFDQLVAGNGYSFPSGHVIGTTALLLASAYLLTRSGRPSKKRIVWGLATAISLLMGLSRVVLGIHWPTDVIAGLLLGTACVAIAALSSRLWTPTFSVSLSMRTRRLMVTLAGAGLLFTACSSGSA